MAETILTGAQIVELARNLGGSTNPAEKARARYGATFRDPEDWERLRAAGVFRCAECSCWHGTDEETAPGSEVCCECADGGGND